MGATHLLRAAVELVLPRACAGCGAAATWWCDACARSLELPPQTLTLPRVGSQPELRWACAAPYRGPAGAALVAMKERGVVAALAPLADALTQAVVLATSSADPARPDRRALALVPAPSRPAAVRARGADVVADLARACAARLVRADGRDVRVVQALTHTRVVADQAALGPAERASNLAGAMRARPISRTLLAGRVVVVVDDVLTTGATAREAARAVVALCPGQPVVAATVAGVSWSGPIESGALVVGGRAGG